MAPEDFRLVEIAFLSGMRATEQFRMEMKNVHFDANVIRVPDSKNDTAREIPMCKRLRELCLEAKDEDWLCNSPTRCRWDKDNFSERRWRPALKETGIKNFRWHDLRHTFASRLVMRGIGLAVVRDLLGHHSITVTERYAHLAPNLHHQAVTVLDENSPGEKCPVCGSIKPRAPE